MQLSILFTIFGDAYECVFLWSRGRTAMGVGPSRRRVGIIGIVCRRVFFFFSQPQGSTSRQDATTTTTDDPLHRVASPRGHAETPNVHDLVGTRHGHGGHGLGVFLSDFIFNSFVVE